MPNATMSILGLYDYDDSIFDNLVIPTGMTKSVVTDNILLECAELELIYPDFDYMKLAIGKWSTKELVAWNKLYATTNLTYNPIYNKDGTINEVVTETRNLADASTDTTSASSSGSSTTDQDTTSTNTDSVSAYNVSTFSNRDKSDGAGTNDVTVEDEATSSSSVLHSGTDTGTITHATTRHESGNIGVTTTQEMIKQEREIDEFNMYSYIVDAFKNRFCLLIY